MRLWFGGKKIPLTAPGPSPWYLRAPWAQIQTSRGTWSWGFHEGPKLAGLSYLLSPGENTVLVLDFHFYVSSLSEDRLLIWHESGRESEESSTTPCITFTLLHLNELRPLGDPVTAGEQMRAAKHKILFDGGTPAAYEFPSNVPEGTHAISPPAPFLDLPELLVLGDFGPESGNHFDKMFRALVFNFKSREVSVLPQRWFNEGNYDFGYQWVTRVQREDRTGQIVGEGIRLGNFRLDRSGTQVEEWLHKDAFYHPEHEP